MAFPQWEGHRRRRRGQTFVGFARCDLVRPAGREMAACIAVDSNVSGRGVSALPVLMRLSLSES